jgi:hypothetical protein
MPKEIIGLVGEFEAIAIDELHSPLAPIRALGHTAGTTVRRADRRGHNAQLSGGQGV